MTCSAASTGFVRWGMGGQGLQAEGGHDLQAEVWVDRMGKLRYGWTCRHGG